MSNKVRMFCNKLTSDRVGHVSDVPRQHLAVVSGRRNWIRILKIIKFWFLILSHYICIRIRIKIDFLIFFFSLKQSF